MSVGFLHTPNFAAFWPKPQNLRNFKKHEKVLGQCAGVMQTVLHLTPPPTDIRLLSKTGKKKKKKKKTSRYGNILSKTERNLEKPEKNQRFQDNVLVSCKQSVGQIVFVFF